MTSRRENYHRDWRIETESYYGQNPVTGGWSFTEVLILTTISGSAGSPYSAMWFGGYIRCGGSLTAFIIGRECVYCGMGWSWRRLSIEHVLYCARNVMTHGDPLEGKWRGNWRMEWVASTLIRPRNMVYPPLLTLMRTTRLPAVDWTDSPAYLNGLVRLGERRNVVSARVPSGSARALQRNTCRWLHSDRCSYAVWLVD